MKIFVLNFLLGFYALTIQAQDKIITLGSGGGLTGAVTVFKITEKGEVFKGKGLGQIVYSECGKIKKSLAAKFLDETTTQLQMPDFNHPGNMYFFLSIVEDDDKSKKITWGDNSYPVQASIEKLYQEIQSTINTIKFKPIPVK